MLIIIGFIALLSDTSAKRSSAQDEFVHLAHVESIEFYKARTSIRNRTESIPQLNCYDRHCDKLKIESACCKNVGKRNVQSLDVTWDCVANTGVRMVGAYVECETETARKKQRVRRGSCALWYRVPSRF